MEHLQALPGSADHYQTFRPAQKGGRPIAGRVSVLALTFLASLGLALLFAGCKGTSAQQLHDNLHAARVQVEPIVAELVALEDDPGLTARFKHAQTAADAVHVAFDAYLAEDSAENRDALKAALAAATAAADHILASLDGSDEGTARARLYIRLALVLVNVTAAHLGGGPAPAHEQ